MLRVGCFPVVAIADGVVFSPKDLPSAIGDAHQLPQTALSSWPGSAKEFLLLFPPAPYTATRALSRRDHRILMLDFHVKRLGTCACVSAREERFLNY